MSEPTDTATSRRAEFWADARFSMSHCWRAHRALTAAFVVIPLVQALLPAALVLTLRGLINEVTQVRSSGSAGDGQVRLWIVLGLVVSLASAALSALSTYVNSTHYEWLDSRISVEIPTHASRLPYSVFEDREFQDTLTHINDAPASHVQEFVSALIAIVAAGVRIASLLLILFAIKPLLIVLLVPIAIPYLFWQIWVTRLTYDEAKAQLTKRRWAQYYIGQLTSAGSVAEVRVLDLGPVFIERTREILATFRHRNHRFHVIQLVGTLMFVVLSIAAIYFSLYEVAKDVVAGSQPVGDVAIFGASALGLRSAVDSLVSSIGSFRWHTLYVSELRTFLALPTAPAHAGPTRATDGIGRLDVEGVTFTYPGTEHVVLRDVNLCIAPGEVVAIVGENGSGKSTLVKLIAGLYTPDQGRILLDGIDIAGIDAADLAREVTFVFQNVGRYEATAGENIAYGNAPELLDDEAAIRDIVDRVGIGPLIDRMPEGIDTMLGRRFGVYDLSGGQWQQMAIARANARSGSIQILDEPTSSLDVKTEYRIFSKFRDLSVGRTTILISHRFSTVSLADRIIVMEGGEVSEQGTHEALLARNGTYAHLYRLHRRDRELAFEAGSNDGAS
jgi:ATP-binding cassette subfamily B protein